MKKNKIWWFVCCLFSTYSCSDCSGDDAEKITSKKDTHENYNLGADAYSFGKQNIDKFISKIFNPDKKIDEKILPDSISNKESEKHKDFFYVNNDIVLEIFFLNLFKEKIFIDLILENIAKDDKSLKKNFENWLKNCWEKINTELNNINKSENQILYSKIFDLNKIFQDEVLEKIFPEIFKKLKSETCWDNLKKYANNYTFGLSHIILSELIPDDKERNKKIKSKADEINK